MSNRAESVSVILCSTCGVEYAEPLPEVCPICQDERQWVPRDGQRWTTLADLERDGATLRWESPEPDRHVVSVESGVGIGQSMQVIVTQDGCLVWDPVAYIDKPTVDRIRALGPTLAVAASHPHMFGVQVEWAHGLETRVLVNEADRQWVGRTDPVIDYWSGQRNLGQVSLYQVGGHFAGSSVALWPAGCQGRGTLLTGDTIFPNPDGWSVGFLRSYPNKIPLSAAVVQRIADDLQRLTFDAVIGNFNNTISGAGGESVQRSARRHIAWVRGDHDDAT